MPRVSQRRILIDWFLDGIEKDKAHIEAENLGKFLERHIEAMRDGAGGDNKSAGTT